MMSNPYPHELQFAQLYLSPVIVVGFMAFFLAVFTTILLNKTKLAHYFVAHKYLFLAFVVLYGLIIDRFFIRF